MAQPIALKPYWVANAALGADGKLTMSNIGGTGKGTIDEAVKAAYDGYG